MGYIGANLSDLWGPMFLRCGNRSCLCDCGQIYGDLLGSMGIYGGLWAMGDKALTNEWYHCGVLADVYVCGRDLGPMGFIGTYGVLVFQLIYDR